MLDKLSGTWAPKPSSGPHKQNECLPLILMIRNRLKYALTSREVCSILQQRLVKIDGKVRTDPKYPAGLMDVVEIEKTQEKFRLILDAKGRFKVHKISDLEAEFKLCKVKKTYVGYKGVPMLLTHDGRTIRYPDPDIKANDTIKYDFNNNKIAEFARFETGNLAMITGGRNIGRVGTIFHHEVHQGGVDIVHIKDTNDHKFATPISNVFVLGNGNSAWISLNKDNGIRLTITDMIARQAVPEVEMEDDY